MSLSCVFYTDVIFSTNETEYKDSVEDKPTINGEYLFVVDSI